MLLKDIFNDISDLKRRQKRIAWDQQAKLEPNRFEQKKIIIQL